LGQLSEIENDIIELGYKIIAVSPDRPAVLTETIDANTLPYTLLSDSSMIGAHKLGIAIEFSNIKVAAYKLNNQDIEKSSGEDHHLIPVPTVMIIDQTGVIRFIHTDPNHRKRLDPNELIRVAKEFVNP
jgi:peroxiredoxin